MLRAFFMPTHETLRSGNVLVRSGRFWLFVLRDLFFVAEMTTDVGTEFLQQVPPGIADNSEPGAIENVTGIALIARVVCVGDAGRGEST